MIVQRELCKFVSTCHFPLVGNAKLTCMDCFEFKDVYTCFGKVRAYSCYRSQMKAYMPKLLIMKFVFQKEVVVSVYFDSKLPKKKSNQPIRADLTKCSTDFEIRLQRDQNVLPIVNRLKLHYNIWILSKLTSAIMTHESRPINHDS